MKCINCGKEISDTARFCQYCGKEQLQEKVDKTCENKCDEDIENKCENESIKDADKWTKIIYYTLYVLCSIVLVLIIGSFSYHFISHESSPQDKQVAETDSVIEDSLEVDTLPTDQSIQPTTKKQEISHDSIVSIDVMSEPTTDQPYEPEIQEPEATEPVIEENNQEDENALDR